ncbi:conserved hypothetical protein [Culex quinquefasciatus]|uniref:Uncharacterized protein n=1 Tax=Culex quinquefasciatus TaxID=7176 RepID=B0W7I6_CULQU|nr:conserved hypothetical protein [Culex quinquefasciatus]|eukprot:XP_001844670.1 conserved hypothetical protein [Culex quinquefasciatus]
MLETHNQTERDTIAHRAHESTALEMILHTQLRTYSALPEVIQRNCRNCSPQQAQNAQKLTNFLQTRYPEVWAMLIRKYGAV